MSVSSDRPPRRANLADEVSDHIRNAIITGRLRPGERIDQDAIAAELGLSRLPVREALIALDREGMVQTIPRRGTYVQRLTPDDIADHYQIFGHVAGLAASRAAARAGEEDLQRLRELQQQMQRSQDAEELERLNFEFHRVINAAGGSRRLNSLIRLLTRSLPAHFFEFVPGWSSQAHEQHAEILSAIERRDPTAAQRAMERHLAASARNAVDALTNQGFFGDGQDDADVVSPP
jgi:DNA-binding GntR family transcriptional regulator